MNTKCIALCVAALAAGLLRAEEPAKPDVSGMSPQERTALREKIVMEKHGGLINLRGTPSGSIVVLNAQKKVSADNFEIDRTRAMNRLRGLVKVVDGEAATVATASDLRLKHKADFLVCVVDDKSLPPALVAPESRWAIVNVAGLEPGAATPEMVRIRTRNEFARVFAMLCGASDSQFKSPIMNYVKEIGDLDNCLAELPVDVATRVANHLDYRNVKPVRKVSYRRACQDGWAPQPTNSFQKAVWDEVHQVPTKPIKIKYDAKKGE